jgi:hypothetical protein
VERPVVNNDSNLCQRNFPIEVLATLRSIVRCGWVELGFNRRVAGYCFQRALVSSHVVQTAPLEILRLFLSISCVTQSLAAESSHGWGAGTSLQIGRREKRELRTCGSGVGSSRS